MASVYGTSITSTVPEGLPPGYKLDDIRHKYGDSLDGHSDQHFSMDDYRYLAWNEYYDNQTRDKIDYRINQANLPKPPPSLPAEPSPAPQPGVPQKQGNYPPKKPYKLCWFL